MKLLKEFKEFAVKGNMMDMAIGIIIGAAFNKLVDVLVKQVFLPPLSLLVEGVNLSDKRIILRHEVLNDAGKTIADEVAIGYGAFSEAFLDFLIVGFTIFIIVKFLNRLRAKSQDPKNHTVSTPKDIELLTKLTDLMEEQNKLMKKSK
ncbi:MULTISPECIES: large conductance mechanosensitive channel protein MscL [Bizionia]|uniref:Large-conductance mechanosensitive channel n=1 Tax=Bizionia algoritergicola TaxID=291187 RepID=A0A5D0QYK6_9FLAO|nr:MULTISPECIES: large conductance mechanosensitive channel protein MscL [Bizionia]OBX21277.1 mechanosensitive ion channel protein MscL [Bizionia sp. APA-3]TYB73294.1 large conductance mechanosensitive channel protein MscL [Bizionia algoritergicola]